jgi:hypothetical protein
MEPVRTHCHVVSNAKVIARAGIRRQRAKKSFARFKENYYQVIDANKKRKIRNNDINNPAATATANNKQKKEHAKGSCNDDQGSTSVHRSSNKSISISDSFRFNPVNAAHTARDEAWFQGLYRPHASEEKVESSLDHYCLLLNKEGICLQRHYNLYIIQDYNAQRSKLAYDRFLHIKSTGVGFSCDCKPSQYVSDSNKCIHENIMNNKRVNIDNSEYTNTINSAIEKGKLSTLNI